VSKWAKRGRRRLFLFIPLMGSNITRRFLKCTKESLELTYRFLDATTKSLDLINKPLDPITLPLLHKGGP
jgi:hypothetical protein